MQQVQNKYEIELPEFDVTDRKMTSSGDVVYTCIPKNRPNVCPICGGTNIDVHKKMTRKVRDLNERNVRVGLVIEGHRYRCRDCGQTIGAEYPSIDGSGKLTIRLKNRIQEEAFNSTFKEVADRYSLSVATVQDIFNEKAKELEEGYIPETPEVLGIDEVHLHKNYCGVYVDVLQQKVIELTENRSKKTVKKFLNELTNKERIVCVTMDMWTPYRDAVHDVLPGVPVIIDKFHVIKELQKQLDSTRVEVSKSLQDRKERASLRGNRYLLLASAENLSKKQNERLEKLLKDFPEFATPYYLKEAFRMIYASETRAEAEQTFKEWCEEVERSGYKPFKDMINTVNNWYTEIFNYFDNKYTNAETESLNRVIRDLDREGRGYSFDTLRAKAIFHNNYTSVHSFSFD